MPTEVTAEIVRSREEDDLRTKLAVRHLADVRRFKVYLSVYLLLMLVLTPVWIVTHYYIQGGWPTWIIWVALIGAVIVAIPGYRAYFRQADSEAGIQREIERLERRAETGYARNPEATGTHGHGYVGHLPPE